MVCLYILYFSTAIMAEKLLETSSPEGISYTLQTDSVFSGNESEYLLLAFDSLA